MLLGAADPGGRLPQTFPRTWADNPTASRDPEVYPGLDGNVRYAEGIFVGYRHYDRAGIAPLFAFGHGLGYTRFALEAFEAEPSGDGIAVRATLRNTGDRPGATVLQIYLGDPVAALPRPPKELKAFAKLRAAPGETCTATFRLTPRDLAFYDPAAGAWRIEPGSFDLFAGFSATDIRATARIEVTEARLIPRSG